MREMDLRHDCISPVIRTILHQKGIKNHQEIRKFLFPDVSCLSDPFAICGMQRACEIIEKAIYLKKRIFLYADGDVDGISGAVMLLNFFSSIGIHCDIKLTHRLENYEIDVDFVEKIQKLGYDLFVAIDTGTSSKKTIEYCENKKFPAIILDHHQGEIPGISEYVTIVNPSLEDNTSILTASGLSFKLVQSLRQSLSFFPEETFNTSFELATIGTLSDYGKLAGENRIIVKIGLEMLKNTCIPGIRKFINYFYVPEISSYDIKPITHYLNPKLNTPGRFGRPELTLKILTADVDENIQPVFEEIESLEREKQKIVKKVTNALGKSKKIEGHPFFIFEKIPVSFSGMLAARISEKFEKPALVGIKHSEILQGSARSYDKINLYDFFKYYGDLFISFGGHKNAVGFRMKTKFLSELKNIWTNLKIQDFPYTEECETLNIELDMIDVTLMENLQSMMPFGYGNPCIFFKSSPVHCLKITRQEKNKVVAWIKQNGKIFEAHFPKGFKTPSRPLSIVYFPVIKTSGNLYVIWLDVRDWSEII